LDAGDQLLYWVMRHSSANGDSGSAMMSMKFTSSQKLALDELRQVFLRSYVWRALAFADIRSKYRFSTFGSLWLTLSTGIMVLSIGVIYGQFFGQNITSYLPYFAIGMVTWTFIASVFNEATTTLISASTYIKGSNFAVINHVFRTIHRQFLIFLHNLIVVIIVFAAIRWPIDISALLSLLGFAILYIFLVGAAVIISMLSVRYRDVPPMVGAGTQFIFFATPIIWYSDQIKVGAWIVNLNPLAHLVFVVRDPLLGRTVHAFSWFYASGFALLTVGVAVLIYTRFRNRVAFWV
jgi:ABC-type polysaccharide/polyol phosphate export permease